MTQWMPRLVCMVAACGLLCGGLALAQDKPTDASEPDMARLQEELKAIREELAAVRTELRQVSAQLRALQAAQKPAEPRTPPKPDDTVYDIPAEGAPIRGPKDAPVTIVEYASFACGWCIREDPTLTAVQKEYPEEVRLVFKHFPMWPKAKAAHAATALAMQQLGNEGFWKMHDKIIQGGTKKLEIEDLRKYAEELGMDLAAFDATMADDKQVEALADVDSTLARQFGVRGTPSIFINGKRLQGQRTVENYKAQIDAALKEAKGEKTGG